MEQKPYRPFRISCGLQEGYATQNFHTLEYARSLIEKWQEGRLRAGKKILVGTLLEGQYIYPEPGKEVGSATHEAALHYEGMAREDASDTEVLEALEDLARVLTTGLGQKRIHLTFDSAYFIVEHP